MQTEDFTILEAVEDHQIACDWGETYLHEGDGPATFAAYLISCRCGRQGVRLVCAHCVSVSMTTEDSAECHQCGMVVTPWRKVISRIEPI